MEELFSGRLLLARILPIDLFVQLSLYCFESSVLPKTVDAREVLFVSRRLTTFEPILNVNTDITPKFNIDVNKPLALLMNAHIAHLTINDGVANLVPILHILHHRIG